MGALPPRSPQSIRDITAEWLQQEIRRSARFSCAKVRSVRVEPWKVTTEAQLVRLQVAYSDNSGNPPSRCIVKLPGPNASGHTRKRAKQEILFYRRVAPATPLIRVPYFFGGAYSREGVHYHLILEDLSLTHFTAPRPRSPADCVGIIDLLAKLHASWWEDPRLGRGVGKPLTYEHLDRHADSFASNVKTMLDQHASSVSREDRKACEELISNYRHLLEMLHSAPQTIRHGDVHFGNFLHRMNGGRETVGIDWQFWRIGPGVADVAQLLGLRIGTEQRRECERDLLLRYHKALQRFGVDNYSWELCWRDYCFSTARLIAYPAWRWIHKGGSIEQLERSLKRALNGLQDVRVRGLFPVC